MASKSLCLINTQEAETTETSSITDMTDQLLTLEQEVPFQSSHIDSISTVPDVTKETHDELDIEQMMAKTTDDILDCSTDQNDVAVCLVNKDSCSNNVPSCQKMLVVASENEPASSRGLESLSDVVNVRKMEDAVELSQNDKREVASAHSILNGSDLPAGSSQTVPDPALQLAGELNASNILQKSTLLNPGSKPDIDILGSGDRGGRLISTNISAEVSAQLCPLSDEANTSDISESSTEIEVNTAQRGPDVLFPVDKRTKMQVEQSCARTEAKFQAGTVICSSVSTVHQAGDCREPHSVLKPQTSPKTYTSVESSKPLGDCNGSQGSTQSSSTSKTDSMTTPSDTSIRLSISKTVDVVSAVAADFQGNQLPAIHNFFPDANFSKYNKELIGKQDSLEPSCHGLEQTASHDSSGYLSGVSIVKGQCVPKGGHWSDALEATESTLAQVTNGLDVVGLSSESSFNSDYSESTTFTNHESPEVNPHPIQGDVQGTINKEDVAPCNMKKILPSTLSVNVGENKLYRDILNKPGPILGELYQEKILTEIDEKDRNELEKFITSAPVVGNGCNVNNVTQTHVPGTMYVQNTQPRSGNMIHLQNWQSMPMNTFILDNCPPQATQMSHSCFQGAKNCLPKNPSCGLPMIQYSANAGTSTNTIQVVCDNQQFQQSSNQIATPRARMSSRNKSVGCPSLSNQIVTYDNTLNGQGPYIVQNAIGYVESPGQSFNQPSIAAGSEPVFGIVAATESPQQQPSITVTKHPGQRTVDYIDSLLMTCDASNYQPAIRPSRPRKESKRRNDRRSKSSRAMHPDLAQTPDQELQFIRSYQHQRKRGGGGVRCSHSLDFQATSVGIQCDGDNIDETSQWLQEYCAEVDSVAMESPTDYTWGYATVADSDVYQTEDANNNNNTPGHYYQSITEKQYDETEQGESNTKEDKQTLTPAAMEFAQQIAKARPNTIVKYSEQILDCGGFNMECLPVKEVHTTPKTNESNVMMTSGPVSESSQGSASYRDEERTELNDKTGSYPDRPCGETEGQVEICDENPIPEVLNLQKPAAATAAVAASQSPIVTTTIKSPGTGTPFLKMQMLCEAVMQSPAIHKQNMECQLVPGTMTPVVDILNTPELTNALSQSSANSPGSSNSLVPKTPLLTDEVEDTSLNEEQTEEDVQGQAAELMANTSSVDMSEYEEEHRFEDQEYVTSFIKSFRNNPRRYKVYPEAALFRKSPWRPKKYTKHTKSQPKLLPKLRDQKTSGQQSEAEDQEFQIGNFSSRSVRCTRASKSEGQQVSELLQYISGLNGQVKKLNKRTEPVQRPKRARSVYVRQRDKPLDLSNKPKKSRAKRKVKVTNSETSVATRASTGESSSTTDSNTPPSRCNSSRSKSSLLNSPVLHSPKGRQKAGVKGRKTAKTTAHKLGSRAVKRKQSDTDQSGGVKKRKMAVSKRKISVPSQKQKACTKSDTSRCLRSTSDSHYSGGGGGGGQLRESHTLTSSDPLNTTQNAPLDLSVRKRPGATTQNEVTTEPWRSQSESARRPQRGRTARTVSGRKGRCPVNVGIVGVDGRKKGGRVKRSVVSSETCGLSSGDMGGDPRRGGKRPRPGRPRLESHLPQGVDVATGKARGDEGSKARVRAGRGRTLK